MHTSIPTPEYAGWHPDPAGSSRLRYFNGEMWTAWAVDPDESGVPSAPPVACDPLPEGGLFAARRAKKRTRVRQDRAGLRLIQAGALVVVLSLVWVTLGHDVYGRWQQYELRRELADQAVVMAAAQDDLGPIGWTDDPTLGFVGYSADDPTFTIPTVAAPAPPVAAAPSGPQLAPAPQLTDADAVGRMQIDKIGLDWVVGVGVEKSDLRDGPGWMPETTFPGMPGNTVLSGHRTTYGAPFGRLDELAAGDKIVISMPGRTPAVYEVRDVFVVRPDEVGVAAPGDGVRLTLTTCHPKGSAKQRLIVQAELVSGDAAELAVPRDSWQRYSGNVDLRL